MPEKASDRDWRIVSAAHLLIQGSGLCEFVAGWPEGHACGALTPAGSR